MVISYNKLIGRFGHLVTYRRLNKFSSLLVLLKRRLKTWINELWLTAEHFSLHFNSILLYNQKTLRLPELTKMQRNVESCLLWNSHWSQMNNKPGYFQPWDNDIRTMRSLFLWKKKSNYFPFVCENFQTNGKRKMLGN